MSCMYHVCVCVDRSLWTGVRECAGGGQVHICGEVQEPPECHPPHQGTQPTHTHTGTLTHSLSTRHITSLQSIPFPTAGSSKRGRLYYITWSRRGRHIPHCISYLMENQTSSILVGTSFLQAHIFRPL